MSSGRPFTRGNPSDERGGLIASRLGSFCAGPCPTPQNRSGFPIGECPVCGSFWIIRWGGTVYGYARISAEDYKAWLTANGYGPRFDGRTVLPAWDQMPNVKVLTS